MPEYGDEKCLACINAELSNVSKQNGCTEDFGFSIKISGNSVLSGVIIWNAVNLQIGNNNVHVPVLPYTIGLVRSISSIVNPMDSASLAMSPLNGMNCGRSCFISMFKISFTVSK
ncbi:hypothetical protein D3C78_1644470 [compost metagenome]